MSTNALLIANSDRAVLAELKRRQARGAVASAGRLHLITVGPHAGRYAVPVTLIPPRPDPRWAVVCRAVGFVMLGTSAVLGSVAWLLASLSGAALFTVCLVALGLLVARVKLKHGHTSVTVKTYVNVR